MQKLLADIPKGHYPVVDPFMGSGTTGLACIATGHNFIGIDREPEYVAIATARAERWRIAKEESGDSTVQIQSDKPPPRRELGEYDPGSEPLTAEVKTTKQKKPRASKTPEEVTTFSVSDTEMPF